jgi:4-amino-4-deoxy-L-arabinose transferase-like glycosyltransferase
MHWQVGLAQAICAVWKTQAMLGNEIAAPDEYRWKRTLFLHFFFWIGASVIGALHAWSARHSMNADGISYLDMADAYMHADWNTAINAYWSPLYAWLLGAAMHVLRPSSYWEYPVVHLVNFAIYLISLGCFAFLLSEVMHYGHGVVTLLNRYAIPDWACVVIGYSLFIWSSVDLSSLSFVTPDGCVAALVYLAAGLLVRIKRKREAANLRLFVCLGLVLGLAYLAKAPMFLLAFVFLSASMLPIEKLRQDLFRSATALAVFILVASPFVVTLSIAKGRLTYSDTGKLAYAVFVGGTKVRHWQGENPNEGVPKHTTRKIVHEPAVYEFETPLGVTYPPWYDPSYWFEGLKIQFSLPKQIGSLRTRLGEYSEIFFDQSLVLTGLIVGATIFSGMGWGRRKFLSSDAVHWYLIAPAIAAFAMYSLVHVESRYVAPFIVLFWLGIFSTVIVPASVKSKGLVSCVTFIMFALMAVKIVVPAGEIAYATVRELVRPEDNSATEMWRVADGLHAMGIHSGDRVAIIGWGSEEARWARLARVKIIAEIPALEGWGFFEGDKFWSADETIKSQVYHALARTGVKIMVARVADSAPSDGWHKIENTTYWVHFL